jgi:hypothetical protein
MEWWSDGVLENKMKFAWEAPFTQYSSNSDTPILQTLDRIA